MRRATATGAGLGVVIGAGLLVAANYFVAPWAVDLFLPVLTRVRVLPGATVHSDGVGSFYLSSHKRRQGEPEYYVFYLVTPLGQGIPLDTYRAEPRTCEETAHDGRMVNHERGTTWTQHYCFKLPPGFVPESGFSVIGEAGHRAWPWTHLIVTKLPKVVPKFTPGPYHSPFGGLP